jgi:hypothetical protein
MLPSSARLVTRNMEKYYNANSAAVGEAVSRIAPCGNHRTYATLLRLITSPALKTHSRAAALIQLRKFSIPAPRFSRHVAPRKNQPKLLKTIKVILAFSTHKNALPAADISFARLSLLDGFRSGACADIRASIPAPTPETPPSTPARCYNQATPPGRHASDTLKLRKGLFS